MVSVAGTLLLSPSIAPGVNKDSRLLSDYIQAKNKKPEEVGYKIHFTKL